MSNMKTQSKKKNRKQEKAYHFYTTTDWKTYYKDKVRGIKKPRVKYAMLPHYEDIYSMKLTKKNFHKQFNKWSFTVQTERMLLSELHDSQDKKYGMYRMPRVGFDVIGVRRPYLNWKWTAQAVLFYCELNNLIGDVYVDDIRIGSTYTTTKRLWWCSVPSISKYGKKIRAHEMIFDDTIGPRHKNKKHVIMATRALRTR